MQPLAIAIFLSVAANRITEAFVRPIKVKYAALDMWWLIYPTWILGGVLAWLAGINLFDQYFPAELTGRIMTALVVGGGANLIANVFGEKS